MTYSPKDFLAQTILKDLGYYRGALDGLWGVKSQQALDAWEKAQVPESKLTQLAKTDGVFDPRTEACIATLLPKAREAARAFMAACVPAMARHGVVVKIIGGTRTYAEQNALYEQGRGKPGPVVTNARGGYSNHNFGIAWDIGLFKDGRYLEESPLYKECSEIGREQGLDCGAFWSSLTDEPHFNLKTGLTLAQMREKVARGETVV